MLYPTTWKIITYADFPSSIQCLIAGNCNLLSTRLCSFLVRSKLHSLQDYVSGCGLSIDKQFRLACDFEFLSFPFTLPYDGVHSKTERCSASVQFSRAGCCFHIISLYCVLECLQSDDHIMHPNKSDLISVQCLIARKSQN